jgi:hypothetical protein
VYNYGDQAHHIVNPLFETQLLIVFIIFIFSRI